MSMIPDFGRMDAKLDKSIQVMEAILKELRRANETLEVIKDGQTTSGAKQLVERATERRRVV